MAELAPTLPAGMAYSIPFDTAPFVKISIEKVVQTLLEAMVLVFLVMYLFLQNALHADPGHRRPHRPAGHLRGDAAGGFSINVLTMFGMVLAIGIIVDDAIVVVENVERLMARRAVAREATSRP
jgi:multidrug efflux pump